MLKILSSLMVAAPLVAFSFASGTENKPLFADVAFAGYGQQKVIVCHKGKSIYVAPSAVQAHIGHGDYLGMCR